MPTAPVVDAAHVSVAYRLQHDPTPSVQEFTINLLRRRVRYEDLWALRM